MDSHEAKGYPEQLLCTYIRTVLLILCVCMEETKTTPVCSSVEGGEVDWGWGLWM